MKSSPKVSVITPCFNAGPSIKDTIESVINQTFLDWEMLIIDDCSTDNSVEIINALSDGDERIRLIKNDIRSGSPSLPRNIGIDNATGKYIAFLDSDDIWFPNKLEEQVRFMEKNKVSFCYSDYEKMDCNGVRNDRIVRMPKKASFWDVIESCVIPCLTVVLSKEVIGTNRFKNLPKEDWVFWLDILRTNGVYAQNCGNVLALYREQKGSRSANKILMVRNQWYILRNEEGVKPILAFYFMFQYILHGIIKYLK